MWHSGDEGGDEYQFCAMRNVLLPALLAGTVFVPGNNIASAAVITISSGPLKMIYPQQILMASDTSLSIF